MAKKNEVVGPVKVRVLRECDLGKCDDVAEIDGSQLDAYEGAVDADPAAVAYAESLTK